MTAAAQTWSVDVNGESTTAAWEPASSPSKGVVFVCAHGAGGHMGDASVLAATRALRSRGIGTVRFNFLYRERGHARPDSMPRLLACLTAVIDRVRSELAPNRLMLGGRSMGGRAASMLVSQGTLCDRLLLLAYPLHPPGQPKKVRVAHLPAIDVPVLCVNGTRDPFCTPDLMNTTLAGLGPNWQMLWLDGADHSFHVLKRSGRTDEMVLEEVAARVAAWVAE